MEPLFDRYFDECQDEIKELLLTCLKEYLTAGERSPDFMNAEKFVDEKVDFPIDPYPEDKPHKDYDPSVDILVVSDFQKRHAKAFRDEEDSSEEVNRQYADTRRARLLATFDDSILQEYEAKRAKLNSPIPESKSVDDETVNIEDPQPEPAFVNESVAVETTVIMETPEPVEIQKTVDNTVCDPLPSTSVTQTPKRDKFGRMVSGKGLYPKDPKYLRLGPENLYKTVINDRRPSKTVTIQKGRFRWNKSTANMANRVIYDVPFLDKKMSVRRARLASSLVGLDHKDVSYCTTTMIRASAVRHFDKTLSMLCEHPDIIDYVKDSDYRSFLIFMKELVSG